MVKFIDLEAPKSPHPFSCSSCLIFLQVDDFQASKSMLKKYRDKLCLGTFDFTCYWLMQVYKPCSCVLRRK